MATLVGVVGHRSKMWRDADLAAAAGSGMARRAAGRGRNVEFTGTADPGAAITIRGTTSILGAGTADSDGRWTITSTRPLSAGGYQLTAQQTPYGAQPISPGVGITFTVR